MKDEDARALRELLTERQVLSLGVLIDGAPYVSLLPFALAPDFGTLYVHASSLARHARGLQDGAPFSALIHQSEESGPDPMQLGRVTLEGEVAPCGRESGEYASGRGLYLGRFPQAEPTFSLGDFSLHALRIRRGRLVAGFARTVNLSPVVLAELAAGGGDTA